MQCHAHVVWLGLSLIGHLEMLTILWLEAFHVLNNQLILVLLEDMKLFVKVFRDITMFVSKGLLVGKKALNQILRQLSSAPIDIDV